MLARCARLPLGRIEAIRKIQLTIGVLRALAPAPCSRLAAATAACRRPVHRSPCCSFTARPCRGLRPLPLFLALLCSVLWAAGAVQPGGAGDAALGKPRPQAFTKVTIVFACHLDVGFNSGGPEPGYDNAGGCTFARLPAGAVFFPNARRAAAAAGALH